jgi:hypothetical protein
MSMFGGQNMGTNAAQNSKLFGYYIQTALAGNVIPVVYGQNRIPGNVIWSGAWQANPVNGGKGKGGKGGKSGNSQQYDYKSSLQIGLCQGPIQAIAEVWMDQVKMNLASWSESYIIPSGGGTFNPSQQSNFLIDNGVGKPSSYSNTVNDYGSPGSLTYTGNQIIPFAKVSGSPGAGQYVLNSNNSYTLSAADAGSEVIIYYTWAIPTTSNTGQPIQNLNLTFFNGALGQSVWSYLTSNFASQALGYSELAHADAENVDLGSAGILPNLGFEIVGILPFGNGIKDAEPGAVINDFLTNPYYGCGLSSGLIDSVGLLTGASSIVNYCKANGIFFSPVMDQQRTAADWLQEWLVIANSEAVYSEGIIKFRTYGDTSATSNGVTFTPATIPYYDLDDDDYKGDGTGKNSKTDPVLGNRPTIQDAYNSFNVEWCNRGNSYAAELMPEKNDWAIGKYKQRDAPVIEAHGITVADVAAAVANTQLKRSVNIRAQWVLNLGWEYGPLEPMDMLTITDPYIGCVYEPVRILEIEEDDNGYLQFTVEEFPWGTARPTLHAKQTLSSFGPGYFSEPGNVYGPLFYEAPLQMTQNIGYELLIGLAGAADWGGCHVYKSTDLGVSYKEIGVQYGPTTLGVLTAALASNSDPDTTDTLSVDLSESGGTLESYTQAQADAFVSVVLVDHEIIAYETATLTGTNQYNLTYLRRGCFGTNISAHDSGTAVMVLDGHCFSYIYDASDIGQLLYLKFTSFNQYNQQEQSLANVTAYPYRLTSPRNPYPWKPAECAADPGMTDLRKTFPIQLQYIHGPDKATGAQILAFGTPNTNVPSTKITAPKITATTGSTGGSIAGGQTVLVCVQAFDASSSPHRTTPSNVVPVPIPSGTNTNTILVTVTWPANNFGGEVFVCSGTDEDELATVGVTLGTNQGSVTLTSIATASAWGSGPVDTNFDHIEWQYAVALRGGINGGVIASVTSTTITMGVVPGNAYGSNQLAGRAVSVLSRANMSQSFPPLSYAITGSTSKLSNGVSVTLTIGTHTLLAGDVVAICTLASTYSATTIGDSLLLPASNQTVGQYLGQFGTEVGAIVRLISGQGAGPANDRKVTAVNTSSGVIYTVDKPFSPVPNATTVFILLGGDWFPAQSTKPSQIAGPLADPMQPHVISVPNITGMFLLEALAADANGDTQDTTLCLWRYWWNFGQGSGYFLGSIVSNVFTPDLSQGFAQEVVLNQPTQISIDFPIWTGGAAQAGVDITIVVTQDATGGRPAPAWNPGYVGITAADQQISGEPDTYNLYKFHLRADGNFALIGLPVIGKPIA